MTQEILKLSQAALAGLKDVKKQVRELVAENKALKEALAQTQEPVAQPASEEDMKIYKTIVANYHKDLSTPPQRTWVGSGDLEDSNAYLTPPQRTWVGLTEERVKEIWLKGKDHGDDWTDVLALARSFEAELKGLNT